MSDTAFVISICTLVISMVGLFVACCTPVMTALANVIMFGGFKYIRDRLVPRAPNNTIGTESVMVCKFQAPGEV